MLTDIFFSFEQLILFQDYLRLGLHRPSGILVVREFKSVPATSDFDYSFDYIGIVGSFLQGIKKQCRYLSLGRPSASKGISLTGNGSVNFLWHSRWIQYKVHHIGFEVCQSRNCFNDKTSLIDSDFHGQALSDLSLILWYQNQVYTAKPAPSRRIGNVPL